MSHGVVWCPVNVIFFIFKCSLAAKNLPITAADTISASKIQEYFEEVTGKKDWSKRGWAEWCAMEKGLQPESMQFLLEVRMFE